MMDRRIDFTVTDGIAHLRLAAPARRNAIDLAFCEAFAEAALACDARADLAAILLDAEGDLFSVGGDIDEFIANADDVEPHVLKMSATFHVGVAALARARAPLVVAVRGTVAGGALSLLGLADIAIAGDSTRICAAFTRTGLTPDGGATFLLTRMLGYQRAFDILALNPVLTAEEALRIGLVSRVYPDATLETEVEALLAKLKAMPAGTLGTLKRLMRGALTMSLDGQLAAEARTIAASAARPGTMERLRAFLARSGR